MRRAHHVAVGWSFGSTRHTTGRDETEGTIAAPLQATALLGRYQLEEQIGEGAFATTYRARDSILGRTVALKVLRPELAADEIYLARFAREARAAAAVDHLNVVHVFDYGEDHGAYYLALQYIHGTTLKEIIRRDAPLPPAEAARLTGQILRGLAAIHATGIIHRDVKPHNVLIDREGVARLTDFGIAHDTSETGLTGLTGHGTAIGTPSYMAPEQASGRPVTVGTDVYATGVVLFELLTGQLPFQADSPMAIMLAHLQKPPPSPREVVSTTPAPLETVVLTALAKEPRDRYPSAEAMERALVATLPIGSWDTAHTRPAATSGALPADPTRPISHRPSARYAGMPPTRRGRRAWVVPLLVAIVALAAIGGALAGAFRGDGDEDRTTPTPNGGNLAAIETPTDAPAATAAPTNEPRSIVLDAATNTPTEAPPEPTEPPAPTDTPEPTATLEPTATSTPRPTETEQPTPTETPEPTATATERPTESILVEAPGEEPAEEPEDEQPAGDAAPTIAPSADEHSASTEGGATEPRSSGGDPISLTFGPGDWQGGLYRGDAAFLGRPWTAIYGAQSGLNQASISFTLESAPSENAELTIVGIDDESGGDSPIAITVNGVEVFAGPSPFPSWDGVGNGENAQWAAVTIPLPEDVLEAGTNEIVATNFVDSANVGLPPYVLLNEVRISTM